MKKLAVYAFILLFTCSAFAEEFGQVDIHGFVSQGYLLSSDNDIYYANTSDGTFEFNEMGINFATDLAENLRVGMQLFAKDLGELGNDEIVIDWAYADYRYRNWLGLRVGKVKKPNGMYNQTRDIDSTRTCIFLPPSIYNETHRESQLANKGFGLYGTLPGHVEYEFVYGVFDVSEDGGVARMLDEGLTKAGLPATTNSVDVENNLVGAFMWHTPLEGLSVGGTWSEYKFTHDMTMNFSDPLPGEYEINGEMWLASVEYVFNDLLVAAEYKLANNKTELAISQNTVNNTDRDAEDYYVMLNYRFSDWFELGTYYSVHYANKDDKDGKELKADGTQLYQTRYDAWLKDSALSARFDINDSWVFKLEGHYMDGLADVDYTSDSNNSNDPASNWFLYAAKMSFSF